MRGWTTKTIGELCDAGGGKVQTGPFGSQLHESDYAETGTPVVMPKNILSGQIEEEGIARVSEAHVFRLRRHKLAKGDIVYGRRGDIGRQALIREEYVGWLCGTGCLRITLGKAQVSPQFLHQYLQVSDVIRWIENQAIGATMLNLNTNILRRIPVTFPVDFQTQFAITGLLSGYDALIENNRRRISLLEKLAEDIYREWFIRFRFPGHEHVETFKGLPNDWEVKKLGGILTLLYGKALRDEDRVPGGVPVYGSSGVVGMHNEALVAEPGLIVGRKGNVGSVYWSDTGFFPIDTVYFVQSKLPNEYVYFLLRSMNFINNDSAVPGLNRGQAYSNQLLLPPVPLIKQFAEIVAPQFAMKKSLALQNTKLIEARDKLLPRLLSGKLAVEGLNIQSPPDIGGELNSRPVGAAYA
ncbi:MAG: restriction endonuclease subunit S [Bryobacteraceae bacterium]